MGRERISRVGVFAVVLGLGSAHPLHAFDPANGDWLKSDPRHVRILTFNVEDGIGVGVPTTPATSTTIGSAYAYIGLICQALQPDVICLQEVEPSGTVPTTQAAVQAWADAYLGSSLMHVYVSSATDSYNRNVNLSRYPFADLNGDSTANYHDIFVLPGPGGLPPGTPNGGHVRGWAQSEIDLPDDVYLGDLFVGNSHLKAGSSAADQTERIVAAQNIAYWINNALNTHVALFSPPQPLDALTPVVLCGDMNHSSVTTGPVPWLKGWTSAANDGTDRDNSEMLVAAAAEPFTGSLVTHDSGSRLDYIIVQDSIAIVAEAFVFNSLAAGQNGALPPELAAVLNGFNASTFASDHRAVVVDLAVPMVIPGDLDRDGDVDADDAALLVDCLTGPLVAAGADCGPADLDADGHVDLRDYWDFTLRLEP